MNQHKRSALALLIAILLASSPSWGNEQEEMEVIRQTTINLIQALVEKGVLTQDAANDLIKTAEKSARKKVTDTLGTNGKVVRVPYVPESVKREIRDQVKQEVVAQAKAERWGDVNAIPEWIDRLKWDGDLRMRYQRDSYATGNASPVFVDQYYGLKAATTGNTTETRERWRLRARLGLTAKISNSVTAGVRLATGSSDDPVSTNQTLGNTANKYSIWLDQAYLKLDPLEWLTVIGGRMPNPWFSTDLVWDADLNFEGVAAKATYRFDERRSAYFTAGVFPLQDIAPAQNNKAKSKWLTGFQGGVDMTSLNGSRAKLGLALYDYKNVEGISDTGALLLDYDATKPQFHQKGNTMYLDPYSSNPKLISKFRELNLTAQLDIANFDPTHIILTGDYVRNIGFDQAEIAKRTGFIVAKKNSGYQLQALVGNAKVAERGDWQAFMGYRHLLPDAVLDAFTDSDFRLGGTDAKGYFIGGNYGLDKNTWISLRWLSADSIVGPPLGIDLLQVDLNAKF